MAESRRPEVCIDSCVIISYIIGGSDRTTDDRAALNGFFNDVYAQNVSVIFPTILRAELLQCNLTAEQMGAFDLMTHLPNFDELPINSSISALAAEIRSHYMTRNRLDRSESLIALSDSMFIATAIVEDCPKLLTYDGDRMPPAKPRKLLGLHAPIAGKYPLHICKPGSLQLGLPQ
jgi:predicted nucleic acid-binding protein